MCNASNAGFSKTVSENARYYDIHARQQLQRTEKRDYSVHLQAFSRLLPEAASVLDIGCGAGEHLFMLKAQGYHVQGIDPSQEMRRLSAARGFEVHEACFETLPTLSLPQVHGIWTAASLLHVPIQHLNMALNNVQSQLCDQGAFFLTVRLGTGATWDSFDGGRVRRLIQLFERDKLIQSLTRAGFEIVYESLEESYWGRSAQWLSLIGRKLRGSG